MIDGGGPAGRRSSPYSRTGLFPWGSTYEVPARRDGERVVSHTPCHLRQVELPVEPSGEPSSVHCAVCGRAWSVVVATAASRTIATWTA